MQNRHGTPIWYELMTRDPLAARRFYGAVVGWQIDAAPPQGAAMDYRMISAGDGLVGGVLKLSTEMVQHGATPCWLMYLGVDDVDDCVATLSATGGKVLMPAFDLPNVGRIAMVADPQGAPFYVMHGSSDEQSTVYDPERPGHGAWHELHASHGERATEFYLANFDWDKSRGVDMGPMGLYQLFAMNERDLGGIMNDPNFPRPAWLIYFRVDGIEQAAQRIIDAGGKVTHGPMEVPGGGWIVNGQDPEGVMFALTGTR